ncbi:CPBP family intramembrane metalloprotease [Paenibacillus sp. N3.4]|nr:CPBP family intramembrane metalloprotease [Paenibacillus sp. N3.4]
MSISILTIAGKVLLTFVFIALITVILSIAAAVAAIVRQPNLEFTLSSIAQDPFFVQSALWAQIIGFIGGVLITFAIFERRKGWSLGLQFRQFPKRLGEGFLAGAVLITLSCGGIWLFGGASLLFTSWTAALTLKMLGSFLLFIGVGVNEELFARGFLQGLVKAKFGASMGMAVSTFVFALLHSFNPGMWDSPLPFINLLLAGLLFAVCREYSGGLWMPIGMHVSWNFFQGCMFGFGVSGTPMVSWMQAQPKGSLYLSGGIFGAEGSFVTTVILLIGILGLYAYYHKLSKNR